MIDVEKLTLADKPVLVIAGATATGKSALALSAARQGRGVIINADSMQIYDAIPLLTAQPSALERQQAPHRLYGEVPPREAFSAARWAKLAKAEINAAWRHEQLPIVVGGTGLYLRTLIDGISPIPVIDPAVRAKVRLLSVQDDGGQLHAQVQRVDPKAAARLEPGDTQRLSRALEVFWSSGKTLSDWQSQPLTGGLRSAKDVTLGLFVLERDRAELYARCDERLITMMDAGALDELEALMALDLPHESPIMRAVAAPPLAAYLAGKCTKAEAVELAQRDTRRFAKRQLTWMRQQFGSWKRVFMT
ncbi:MAG: tRNA (adenosine(37)-N6)-dimethylallyltransferase MiaA [Pseudomonadota bacterium]